MFSTTWTNLTLLFLSLTTIHKKHVTIENPFICSLAHSPHLHADDTSVTKEMKNRKNGHQKTFLAYSLQMRFKKSTVIGLSIEVLVKHPER